MKNYIFIIKVISSDLFPEGFKKIENLEQFINLKVLYLEGNCSY